MLSHTNGDGGASLLVDGFRAAEILRSESPDAYEDLCRIKINAHSSGNEGISIMPQQPFTVLVKKDGTLEEPADIVQVRWKNSDRTTLPAHPPEDVFQIRWNNDDRATLPAHNPEDAKRFYAAARKWVGILRRPDSEYWVQLTPGKVLSE